MDEQTTVVTRPSGPPQSLYPGIGNPYGQQQVGFHQPSSIIPAQSASSSPLANLLPGLSKFSINDIKGFVDRMGGIDGIVSTINKMHKTMQSLQQMAPMIKLLASSFGKKNKSGELDEESPAPRRRRRRRRRSSSTRRPVNRKRRR